MKYLLDTDIISELVARQPRRAVLEWIDSVDPHSLYLSVITFGELKKGIEKLPTSRRRKQLHEWVENDLPARFSGRILALDLSVMLTWGELTGRLERRGRTLPAIDSLITAQALHYGCTIVTRNTQDYVGAEVELLNPLETT